MIEVCSQKKLSSIDSAERLFYVKCEDGYDPELKVDQFDLLWSRGTQSRWFWDTDLSYLGGRDTEELPLEPRVSVKISGVFTATAFDSEELTGVYDCRPIPYVRHEWTSMTATSVDHERSKSRNASCFRVNENYKYFSLSSCMTENCDIADDTCNAIFRETTVTIWTRRGDDFHAVAFSKEYVIQRNIFFTISVSVRLLQLFRGNGCPRKSVSSLVDSMSDRRWSVCCVVVLLCVLVCALWDSCLSWIASWIFFQCVSRTRAGEEGKMSFWAVRWSQFLWARSFDQCRKRWNLSWSCPEEDS